MNNRIAWRLILLAFLIGVFATWLARAHAQTPPSVPTSYTFTFPGEAVDAMYNALDRASRMQQMVTGDRSPRYDAIMQQISDDVTKQKAAAAKTADSAKPEAKPEPPKQP